MKTCTFGGVPICVLKSQINEHDKLLLLALASPQVAPFDSPLGVCGGPPQPTSCPHLLLLQRLGTALVEVPITVGGGGRGSQCMGFKVTVGRAKGITVQVNQVVPSAQVQLSATAVQPVADDPGGGGGSGGSILSHPHLSALLEAL